MTIYFFIGSMVLLLLLYVALHSIKSADKPKDSMLRQRAIFNLSEQLTFIRLKEILPDCVILAHVSYDALLTTKYSRTRHKYRNMIADFVVLDEYHQIMAIIELDATSVRRRSQQADYQDALLSVAGYKVIRYEDVPEYYQLRRDFLNEQHTQNAFLATDHSINNAALMGKKQKVLS